MRTRPCLGSFITFASLAACASGTPAALVPGDGPTAAQSAKAQQELQAVAAEVQADIEKLRGVKFPKPVPVQVSDKAALLAYFKERAALETTPDREQFNETCAKLLGLVPEDMDLHAVTEAFFVSQIGGFYDPPSKTFHIIDSFNAKLGRLIMSHELVHALDDQLYDLDGTIRRLKDDTDAIGAYMSLCEGSATYTMTAWQMGHMSSLDPSLLEELQDLTNASTDGVPALVWKPAFASYFAGQTFVNAGAARPKHQRGTDAPPAPSYTQQLERAFRSPPASTEQILHPEKYWDATQRDDPRTIEIDATRAPAGWTVLGTDTLGELHLALLTTPLAERTNVDAKNALAIMSLTYTNDAAAGWDGDRVVLLVNGDARFLQLVTAWDTEADADEFAKSVQAVWAEESKAGDARKSRHATLASDRVDAPGDAHVHCVTLTVFDAPVAGVSVPPPLPWKITR